MPAAIDLHDGTAGYGRTQVFEGMSVRVESGACLAVAGPNGAGKSTLLKAIAGSLPLWHGRLQIDGSEVTELAAEDRIHRGVVLCPEGRRIFSTLSVEENLMLGATPLYATLGRGPARQRIGEGLTRAYDMFPVLKERRASPGGALSGGQQQMLAIARALMSDPRVLLLDEPSLGLAPRITDELYEHLADLRTQGLTLVVVEESATRATGLADDALILRNGRVVLSGPADEIANDPRLKQAYLGTA